MERLLGLNFQSVEILKDYKMLTIDEIMTYGLSLIVENEETLE